MGGRRGFREKAKEISEPMELCHKKIIKKIEKNPEVFKAKRKGKIFPCT